MDSNSDRPAQNQPTEHPDLKSPFHVTDATPKSENPKNQKPGQTVGAETSPMKSTPETTAAETATPTTPPPEKANPQPSTPETSKPAKVVESSVQRSPAEIDALINKVGRTPPDWYESTPLKYPKTLDLDWPQPPPKGGWNTNKNVGQYIWSVINENSRNWHSGIRFLHHMLLVHKDNRVVLFRVMVELGRMYHEHLQDYVRAAFWYRQSGVARSGSRFARQRHGAHLAECYWRLGNRAMAIDFLNKLPATYTVIKLWGDLGETDRSEQLAMRAIRAGGAPNQLYLYIGDAHRMAGNFTKAISAYRKVVAVPATGKRKQRIEKDHKRAQANIAAIQVTETLDLSRIPNGSYRASSLGYETQVHVEVVIRDGRITSAKVTQHREKQYYSSLFDTPRRIVQTQGVRGIDTTSGATITSEAIINAATKALTAAMK
ncbi:MAG: FMN-binding protein [Planctomycetaceae bacterium]|nr:FMN-binding protein [Planctomycetaceae bacterium]MBT6153208.1 FMN-binding protein [Planctomycetaceae bacterium]MBT6484598.1 FMN-binding protein [Planctomycetaceae bacterium]MBT6493310.1 FMN-binding protein [Planctomycetaceae bacterium]